MRSLIRPTLFMMARLGLLFSVIACVFGQTWHGCGFIDRLGGAVDSTGMSIAVLLAPVRWGIEQIDQDVVNQILIGKGVSSGYRHLSLGAVATWYGPKGCVLAARHWLIIAVAALFNVLLMLIYRKKSAPAITPRKTIARPQHAIQSNVDADEQN